MYLAQGATYFVLVFSFPRFLSKFVYIDVALCEPVHDVEIVISLWLLLKASLKILSVI